MTSLPSDLFVMLAVISLAAFSLALGFASITDRDRPDDAHPAE